MAWSKITAGGSATTWSASTAGGSSTTWSGQTAGGSATTWADFASRNSFGWIPFGTLADLWEGVDFVPRVWNDAPLKVDNTRPIVVWEDSVVTSSAFTAEGLP